MVSETSQFGKDVLLVFVGHSGDADAEATAILTLQRDLQHELDRLQGATKDPLPYRQVRLWEWNSDATPEVGGQEAMISPHLDRADIALFVFKERIGTVTWSELERARSRVAPAIPVIAVFPANPPDGSRLNELAGAQGWAELMHKRESLVADWNEAESLSLKPTTHYTDAPHLCTIAKDQMRHALDAILRRRRISDDGRTGYAPAPFLGDASHLPYDKRPVLLHRVEELDAAAIQRYVERPLARELLQAAGMRSDDPTVRIHDKMRALGCLYDGHPTLGAFMCFAPAMLLAEKVQGCSLQMVVYDQPQRAASAPSISLASDNLLKLHEAAMSWLVNRAGLRRTGRVGSPTRDDLEIPEIVLHEAVANALVHRDYESTEIREQPTRLEVYPDRVEITSFGRLPKAVSVSTLNDDEDNKPSWRRNPVIASIFQLQSLVELNASGVSRMRLEMERASLAFPRFTEYLHESIVHVVLLRPARSSNVDVPIPTKALQLPTQFQAYISGISLDLGEQGAAIREVCLKMGVGPVFPELVRSSWEAETSAHLVPRFMDGADLFIGVYGFRYGKVHRFSDGQERSMIDIEYREAMGRGLPMLLFFMGEEHPVRRDMVPRDDDEVQRFDAFRGRVLDTGIVGRFDSLSELQMKASASLRDAITQIAAGREKHARPTPRKPDGVFISCVSDEFEKDGAPFPGLRGQLRRYLARNRINVRVQEDFPQTIADTLKKLADEVHPLAVVIHLVGEKPGAVAAPAAVEAYLKAEPEFLANHSELRAALGDFSGISYTQWEAFIALHHGIPLLVYATDNASAQRTHLDRLALGRRYSTRIASDADLLGQLIGDLHDILPVVPRFTRKISSTQLAKHAPKVLFGREAELAALDAAWGNGTLNIYTLVAWGGAGKTSLVFHWVQTRLAAKDLHGVERYFDWSFYSQGTGESRQHSADLFIAKALEFFGDRDPTQGGAHERGERLAGLIRQHRTLLILDGIEPLQYPSGDPQAGRLKDPALEALLRELAADNPGLVVITTREHLANVEAYATTEEKKLDELSREAAVALLRYLHIVGTDEELHAAWRDAGGHALTLSLLGRFISDAYDDRDIRHYREVKFEAADQEHQGRSAFKVMIAYERWLRSGGPERQRELAVLRLTGLFDRPMAKSSLQALRAAPAIAGLTDTLVKLTAQQWNIAVKRLSEVELLSVSPEAIDAHPLIREYFAAQLKREQPEAFQAAHSRLFDYLCENTPHRPDGIDGLAPLYEAITHGCLAGRHQEACDKIYIDRVLRGTGDGGFYSSRKLGAIGADLAAVAAFFDEPWSKVSSNLTAADQAWLLNEAATHLRAVGRLAEALQPMRAGLETAVRQEDRTNAAIRSSNLSELELMLGRLPDAETDARQSITHADQSGDAFRRMDNRTTTADALHQSGQRAEAGALFAEAERMQQERQPQFDLLYSTRGFQYCDWLLAPAEQAGWRHWLNQPLSNSKSQISDGLAKVERRAMTTLGWATQFGFLLEIALDHLTLARVGLIRAIPDADPTNPQPTLDLPHVAAAVNGLRAAGTMDQLPRGLLTAALYHCVRGEQDLAQKHLAEAQQIAERGPMPLFLADVHLTRARLFRDREALSQAATLIRTLGYGRRSEELATAEKALASPG